jgi:hypothetical protein
MVVKLIKKCSVLPAVCVSLAWFASGCSNSSTNESGSSGATGSTAAAPAKDAPPPPNSVKDYYERSQAAQPASTGKATPTTKGVSK